MDIATMVSRADQLWISRRDELVRTTQEKQNAIVRASAASGMLQSSRLLLLLAELHKENFRNAAPVAWALLMETHRAMGADTTSETRVAMKSWMTARINELRGSASAQIEGDLSRYGGSLRNKQMLGQFDDTEVIANSLCSRHAAIIDNYLDDLVNNPTSRPPVTINAQSIGAVLTGDRAKAHVTQNIGAVEQMRELVGLMREVLKHDAGVEPQRKAELTIRFTLVDLQSA